MNASRVDISILFQSSSSNGIYWYETFLRIDSQLPNFKMMKSLIEFSA